MPRLGLQPRETPETPAPAIRSTPLTFRARLGIVTLVLFAAQTAIITSDPPAPVAIGATTLWVAALVAYVIYEYRRWRARRAAP